MKNKDNGAGLKPEEIRNVENELIKAKLKSEFGMMGSYSDTDLQTENEWLNYIYEWERQFAVKKKIKVYDRIGKPDLIKFEELASHEVNAELEKLLFLFEENGLILDCVCEYEKGIIYKFLTEELIHEEIDDIRIEGMKTHFIYEEFHPNHKYDIETTVEEFFKFFLEKQFDEKQFQFVFLDDSIQYNGIEHTNDELLKKLVKFREIVKPVGIELLEFYKTEFDLEKNNGSSEGELTYSVNGNNRNQAHISCGFKIRLKLSNYGFWEISEVEF
ncbi:MAG: hypothetical protein JSS91_14780 [Bacteroidetes bacterium]|nr:hypothetical protein [Bacteroidota bacterium]